MSRALLPLQLGGAWLALDAGCVAEVLGERPWVPLPGAAAGVPGVLAWRGRAIAVVDLGALLGLGTALGAAGRRRAVVVQGGEHTLALPVDAVHEVVEVADEALRPPHASRHRFAAAEVELAGAATSVLDLGALLRAIAPEAPA